MQNKINEIQTLYREWLQLQDKLQAAQQDWLRSHEIIQQLSDFYFNGTYADYFQAIEDGAEVDLRTQGEYSVMSEDTLWNTFHEHQHMAWQRLHTAVAVLDPFQATNEPDEALAERSTE